jgi:hypothetical protein
MLLPCIKHGLFRQPWKIWNEQMLGLGAENGLQWKMKVRESKIEVLKSE